MLELLRWDVVVVGGDSIAEQDRKQGGREGRNREKTTGRSPCLADTALRLDRHPLLIRATRSWRDGNGGRDVAREKVSGLKALTVYQNSAELICPSGGIDPQHSLENPAVFLGVVKATKLLVASPASVRARNSNVKVPPPSKSRIV